MPQPQRDWTERWTYALEIYLAHMSLNPALPSVFLDHYVILLLPKSRKKAKNKKGLIKNHPGLE